MEPEQLFSVHLLQQRGPHLPHHHQPHVSEYKHKLNERQQQQQLGCQASSARVIGAVSSKTRDHVTAADYKAAVCDLLGFLSHYLVTRLQSALWLLP